MIKVFRFLLLILIFKISPASAVGNFDIYSCKLQVTKIVAFNADTLVAAGTRHFAGDPQDDYSFILRSIDGGITWDYQERYPTIPIINYIVGLSSNRALAVGNSGLLMETNDAGLTWINVSVPTTYNINHIEFTDANTGYATCDRTKYLKTVDGGASWNLVNVANTYNPMFDIYWLSLDTGYICGDGIYRTVNGGANWSQVNISVNARMREMQWSTFSNGFIGTENTVSSGYLLTTAGMTNFTNVPGINFYQLHRFDSLHFIGVSDVYVFETLDGGANWSTKATIPVNYTSLQSVTFFDSLHGWIGGDGIIYFTNDGGTTWQPTQYLNSLCNGFIDISIVDSSGIYSIGSNQLSFTNDGGLHWLLPNSDSLYGARSIDFLSTSTGFAANSGNGDLYLTTDSGTSWTRISTSPGISMVYEITAFNLSNMIRYTGQVETSNDGGQSWTSIPYSQNCYYEKLDSLTGFYQGNFQVHRTTDGGNSYQSVNYNPGNAYVGKFTMADSVNGFNIDQNASLPNYRVNVTRDFWTTHLYTDSFSTFYTIWSTLMLDANTLLVMASDGLHVSIDGGYTFSTFQIPFMESTTLKLKRVNSHYFIAYSGNGIMMGMDVGQLINKINTPVVTKSNLFSVYPNPAQSEFVLRYQPALTNSTVEIINSTGQIVFTKKLNSEPEERISRDLSAGLYFIILKNDKFRDYARLMIR